jgi:hypothetical protein
MVVVNVWIRVKIKGCLEKMMVMVGGSETDVGVIEL